MSSTAIIPSNGSKTTNDKNKTDDERLAKAKAIAMQQALSIEEKKKLQTKVLDMILTAYDLPLSNPADPANPTPDDVNCFRQCLDFLRPSDFDELISERNIDDRCGYALCRKPNLKEPSKKVWSANGRLVDKATNSQWCSKDCRNRSNFVKKQLSEEPVWLRRIQRQQIVLLVDNHQPQDVPDITITQDDVDRQAQLAQERGDATTGGMDNIAIIEKEHTKAPQAPNLAVNDVLEGLPIRTLKAIRKQKT